MPHSTTMLEEMASEQRTPAPVNLRLGRKELLTVEP